MKAQTHDPVQLPVQLPHTWEARLLAGQINESEWEMLREMVDDGEAKTVEEAARLLDFKDRELNLGDTFYGF